MAINKATLSKEVNGKMEYVYPKTSADMVMCGDKSLEDVLDNLYTKEEWNDILYRKAELHLRPEGGVVFEIGSTNNIEISWDVELTLPNTLKAVKVNGVDQEFTLDDKATQFAGNATVPGIGSNTEGIVNIPVVITDMKNDISMDFPVMFSNKVYYGKATTPAEYDQEFIKSGIIGGNNIQMNEATSFDVTTDQDEYIYFALPSSYGFPTFSVGGFDVAFDKVASGISVTNGYGYTTTYDIWRSPESNNGETEIYVR